MNVGIVLAMVVGLVAGILITLLFDGYHFGKKVKQADTGRDQTQQELDQTKTELADTSKKLTAVQNEVKNLSQESEQKETDLKQVQGELDTAKSQIATLNKNLDQVNNHLDKLRQENSALQQQLETAQNEDASLQDDLNRTNNQLKALQEEKHYVAQQLVVAEAAKNKLHQDLGKAKQWVQQAETLAADKETAGARLVEAEKEIVTLRAQLEILLPEAAETGTLRSELFVTEEELITAESQVEDLEEQADMLQSEIDITGENQLQIINGIGPTYAHRLFENGIRTLVDLANADPVKIASDINLEPFQAAHPVEWVTEARRLVEKFREEAQE